MVPTVLAGIDGPWGAVAGVCVGAGAGALGASLSPMPVLVTGPFSGTGPERTRSP
jgi:anti-sigma factor RsiW